MYLLFLMKHIYSVKRIWNVTHLRYQLTVWKFPLDILYDEIRVQSCIFDKYTSIRSYIVCFPIFKLIQISDLLDQKASKSCLVYGSLDSWSRISVINFSSVCILLKQSICSWLDTIVSILVDGHFVLFERNILYYVLILLLP